MKRIISIIIGALTLSSCFKDYNEDYLITKRGVEFEDAVEHTNAPGKNYPLLSGIFASHGVVSYRVNMFGEQSSIDQQIGFRIVEDQTTAIEGRDFRFVTGQTLVVPKNSSYGYLQVEALSTVEGSKLLVIELLGNSEVEASPNYKTIGIPISNAVLVPDPATVEDKGDYLFVNDIILGGDGNPNLGCFIDLQTANIYTWEGAALYSEKATVGYFQSGSNFANFVFPGLSSMATAWNSYYNRILNWSIAPTGFLVRYTNITPADNAIFNDISNASDIETAVLNARDNVGNRHGSASTYGPGERVRSIKPGDIIFMYSSTNDFYAIIRIKEAHMNNDIPAIERTIRFEYKVQK